MASEILIIGGASLAAAVFFLVGAIRAHCQYFRRMMSADEPRKPR